MRLFLTTFTGNLVANASRLDSKRLNKQILEIGQMYSAITGEGGFTFPKSVKNHPETLAYKHHADFLCVYGVVCANEWSKRYNKEHDYLKRFLSLAPEQFTLPSFWWYNKSWLHSALVANHQFKLFYTGSQEYQNFVHVAQNKSWQKLFMRGEKLGNMYPVVDNDKNTIGYKIYHPGVKQEYQSIKTLYYTDTRYKFIYKE